MYETLQLMGSVVAGGFIIVIGIWVAWLIGGSLYRQEDSRPKSRSRSQFNDRPFDERPFDGNDDVDNDEGNKST